MTHTYATLEVTPATFNEIATKLKNAGYDHAFENTSKGLVIDMHGIGLLVEQPYDTGAEDGERHKDSVD